MERKKATAIAIAILLLVGAAGVLWFDRPGRVDAGLLELLPPGADLYLVADLPALQSNPAVRKFLAGPPGFQHDPEYEQFIENTGFRYQEHLKQIAAARFGEDWVGAARIEMEDAERLTRYLDSEKSEDSEYSEASEASVYSFGTLRPFRLAFLEQDRVVFAIGADPERLRGVLQRYRGSLRDSAAGELNQTDEMQRIRPGSGLWFVGRMERLLQPGNPELRLGPFRLNREMWKGSKALYGSVESGPLQLDFQMENLCDSGENAERIASTLQSILAVLQAVPRDESNPADATVTALLAGITIQQTGESVVLRWQGNQQMLHFLEQFIP